MEVAVEERIPKEPVNLDSDKNERVLKIKAYINELLSGNFSPSLPADCQISTELEKLALFLNDNLGEIKIGTKSLDGASKALNEMAKLTMDESAEVFGETKDIATSTVELNSRISSVSAAAEELSVNMESISSSSGTSASNIEQISGATGELKSASSEIAKSTERAADISKRSIEIVKKATDQVSKLNASVGEIASISVTISKISDQTKLLALNATIEAARAGDAGKGFAVVANEVKELSAQTNKSTGSIDIMITDIKAITKETIESINSINGVMKDINSAVTTIAAAAEEQSVTTESIVDNIASTNAQIQTMTSSVQEGALAINEVSKNITGVAELSGQISSSAKNMELNSEKIKDRSVITYANAMEVGSIGDDIKTLVNEFNFSAQINEEADSVVPKLCKFTKRWTVKVDQFDKDHIRIFDYINEIHGKIKEGVTAVGLVETVEALAVFTTEHFAREEKVFISTKYVDYDSHKTIHTNLLATVDDIVNKLKSGEEVNLIEVMVFLKKWLYDHIFGIDKKYSSHLNGHGIS